MRGICFFLCSNHINLGNGRDKSDPDKGVAPAQQALVKWATEGFMRIIVVLMCIAACMMDTGCVSKQTMRVKKTREADQLPRGRKIKYEGGMGESREDAVIIIGAKDIKEGVAAEYDFISSMHGKKDKAWRVKSQSQAREGDKVYDVIEMEVMEKEQTHYIYFDITNCSWKPAHMQ